MASILRSSKFVRYIAGFAKNVVVNTPREFDGTFINTASTQCVCGVIPRNLATQSSAVSDQNLETSLKRIDQDVRRSGRISRRDIEDVLEEIRNTRSATSSQSLLVIRCCGNLVPDELPERRTQLVQEIWNTLKKLNVPVDVSHYNALLRVYLENEHPFSPTEFLTELEKKGIEPNRVTYQRLIARYCQDGDIDGATKILEYMREKQMSVNENVFNALIAGHSKTGDMDSAHGIINVMTQAGLEPSADTYTTLLTGYAMKGDIEKIMSLMEECESKEVYLLDKDYLDIAYALAVSGHTEHLPQVLNKVRRAVGYNQDAINIILRLVNKGQEEAGFMILQTMTRGQKKEDGTPLPSGLFFVKQLVKAGRPIDKIVEYCTKLEQAGLYKRALILATETSLELSDETLAYSLLEKLRSKGVEIRPHFFWPLITSKAGNNQEILAVLHKMEQFDINPSSETLREYVIPNLTGKSSDIIALLREANISVGLAVSSLVTNLLQKQELKEAALIASRVPAFYHPDMVKNPLVQSFVVTQDIGSFVTMLRVIYENADRLQLTKNYNDDEEPVNFDRSEVIGNILLELTFREKNFPEHMESVLQELVNYGLSLSTSVAEKLEERLGEKMTENISSLLGKLTSGELSLMLLEKKPISYVPSSQMNIAQLERLVQNLKAKNMDVKGLLRQLLTLYHRANDLAKAEELLKEIDQKDFIFTNGVYAQLMDLYARHDNLEKALEYYEKVKENSKESFSMDESKIVALAELLIKHGRFDDGIQMLENTPIEKRNEERSFTYRTLVWRFLNSIADKGSVEELDKVFDTLCKKDFIDVTNVLLGPLIKVHLVRNDIDKALEKFEWCVTQFRATPWKNELAGQLIQSEDAEKLQKLTDLSTTVHGEVNSLYDLVFAFVEQGRIRQARKILETPGLQNRPQRFNMVCERYQQEGKIEPLEGLKDATKDLNHIDRTDIYYQLLLSYMKQDDAQKALGLWTQLQEEDLPPTDQFLLTLGKFLQEKNLPVPFVVPETRKPPEAEQDHIPSEQTSFRHAIRSGNLAEALNIKNEFRSQFSVADLSNLIEKLVQTGQMKEASKIAMEIIERGNVPVTRVFKFLLNRLASAGDVVALTQLGSRLSSDRKRIVSFDNRLCHAHLAAGKGDDYLNTLDEKIDNANDENLAAVVEEFPRGGAYGLLVSQPEIIEKYENMAIKYATKGHVAPLNVLWTYYFINGNDQKAEQIWNDYLKGSPRIMFQKIVQAGREKQDESLVDKLINHLDGSQVTPGAMGNAYSCLLDILVAKGKDEEVIKTFEKASQVVTTQHLNRTAVLRVKDVYEKLQRPFDFAIPVRKPMTSMMDIEN